MSSFSIPQTRFTAPAAGRPMLELCHWPLYSTAVLDGNATIGSAAALPRQVSFFNYALGSQVSGNGTGALSNSLRWHTNMETANFLAAPKTMTVTGVRLVVSQLTHTGSVPVIADVSGNVSATANTAFANHAHDLLVLQQYSFRFFVGPKDYVVAPLYAVPGNAGVSGIAANNTQGTTSGNAVSFVRAVATHVGGRSWSLANWPVLIANQQSFGAELTNQFGTLTTTTTSFQAGSGVRLCGQRAITVVLEGILGREVA